MFEGIGDTLEEEKNTGNHPWPCDRVTACISDALAKLAMYPSVRTIFY